MMAVLEKMASGYIAIYERPLKHSVTEVWGGLTQNDKLKIWMSNLEVAELKHGGTVKFNYNDGSGTSIDMKITDYEENSILEFEWGKNRVRFELTPASDGCIMVMKEFITVFNEHTSKDLAGWHVCLDLLTNLLNGQTPDFSMDEWQKWHKKYKTLLTEVRGR